MSWNRITLFSAFFACLIMCLMSFAQASASENGTVEKTAVEGWISLFNGKNLDGWKIPNYGGEGEVIVENGLLTIGMGAMVSGITLDNPFPFKTNYEIEVEAQRTMGSDFYAAITCPVGDQGHVTFINGGWGGNLFGFSCINGFDASENETMKLLTTKNNRWNTFRIRVYDDRIEGWMDNEKVVEYPRDDNKFTTRFEVEYSKPVGVTNYCCETQIRAIRYRELPKTEK